MLAVVDFVLSAALALFFLVMRIIIALMCPIVWVVTLLWALFCIPFVFVFELTKRLTGRV